jgi:hypothetical protein
MRVWLTAVLIMASVSAPAASADLSPLQTVERLHEAMFEANAATADAVLHADYHGVSQQEPLEHRHVHVAARAKAISDIAKLQPGEWQVRFLKTSVGFADTDNVLKGRGVDEVCPDR